MSAEEQAEVRATITNKIQKVKREKSKGMILLEVASQVKTSEIGAQV